MWKLTIEDDEGKQTSLPLAHEEYGLGRADSNAIRLTDRNVSRTHAILTKNAQGWSLKDLNSYNGTYVNGTRVVGEQLVVSGDVVQLGDYRLELLDETTTADVGGGDYRTAAPTAPPIHQRPNRLVLVVGPTPGAEFPLDRDHFTIGRSEEATISINHSSVSRVHAEVIAIGGGRYEIVDKASANGIRINGVELKRGILEAGDALELGDVRLRFVGAGKIYKAFTDQTAQVHPAVAVPGFESVASVRAPAMGKSSGPSVGKLSGIGAAVGIAAIAVFVLMTRTCSSPTNQPSPTPAHQGSGVKTDAATALADAKALADKKDYDGARKRLDDIPEGSPTRDDPAFKEIENAWADAAFAKIEASTDKVEKRKMVQQVSQSTSVDAGRRKKAYDILQAMDAAEPPPPDTAGAAPPPNPGGGHWTPPPTADREPKGTATPAAATVEAPTPVAAPPAAGGADDGMAAERAQIAGLSGKVFGGRGTTNDIKMLKALCAHVGNRDCRDKAAAMLKKKQDAP